ncbi:MAG: hypothetical protein AB8B96_17275 [Lysobacterales bacterium]
MLLTSNKTIIRQFARRAAMCAVALTFGTAQAQETTPAGNVGVLESSVVAAPLDSQSAQPWLFNTPQPGLPTIYRLQPVPQVTVGGPLNIAVSKNLQLKMALPTAATGGVTQTQGIWRPLDSLSLRAGYQEADGSRLLLCADSGNCAPAAASISAEESSLQAYALGASWQVGRGLNLNVDYISQTNALASGTRPAWLTLNGTGLNLGSAEAVDISLTCDINAGDWGDLELGVQVSRLADFNYSLGASPQQTPLNAAAFGVGWQKGTFRGDLTSRYLDVVNGAETAAGWTSFDVSFAWRTPWNASLSVGARNVLNNPAPASNGLSDAELENFFGRVPYVRYRQDL